MGEYGSREFLVVSGIVNCHESEDGPEGVGACIVQADDNREDVGAFGAGKGFEDEPGSHDGLHLNFSCELVEATVIVRAVVLPEAEFVGGRG